MPSITAYRPVEASTFKSVSPALWPYTEGAAKPPLHFIARLLPLSDEAALSDHLSVKRVTQHDRLYTVRTGRNNIDAGAYLLFQEADIGASVSR